MKFNTLQVYDETFSPVNKPPTVRIILTLAAQFHWSLYELDISNAFLTGYLKVCVQTLCNNHLSLVKFKIYFAQFFFFFIIYIYIEDLVHIYWRSSSRLMTYDINFTYKNVNTIYCPNYLYYISYILHSLGHSIYITIYWIPL